MNIILALALHFIIGCLVLLRGMDHMRANMTVDRDYRRMVRENAKGDPAMTIAMALTIVIWPLILLIAFLNRADQQRSPARSIV